MSNGPIIQQKNKTAFKLKQENKKALKPYKTNGKPNMTGGMPQSKAKAPVSVGQQKGASPIKAHKPNAKLAGDSSMFFTK